MPIFVSMIVWICVMRLLCSNHIKAIHLPSGAKGYKVNPTIAILTMGYIVFWIGIRTGMSDTIAYIRSFNNINPDITSIPNILQSGSKGKLWEISIILFKFYITSDWQVWLIYLAIIMGFSFSTFIQKYSEAFFYSMLLFILTGTMCWMYNGMRQFLCVSILVLATQWLIDGKKIKYIILVAILSTVHFSEWLMLPIYFIVRQKPWGKISVLTTMGMCALCLFASPFMETLQEAMQNTEYKGVDIIMQHDDGAHPIRFFIALVPVILAWINRKKLEKENNAFLNVSVNMGVMSAMLTLFSIFTSGIAMGRLPIYCSVYSVAAMPAYINRFERKNTRYILYCCSIMFYSIYFYLMFGKSYYVSSLTGIVL